MVQNPALPAGSAEAGAGTEAGSVAAIRLSRAVSRHQRRMGLWGSTRAGANSVATRSRALLIEKRGASRGSAGLADPVLRLLGGVEEPVGGLGARAESGL